MCTSPVSIKNPNRGRSDKLSYLVDTESVYIKVPCGHCDECIAVRQMNFVQRVQMESIKNHIFFTTLTYNQESLPIKEVNGYRFPFADYKDINGAIRHLRRDQAFPRCFRYFFVSELGSKRSRPHFHGLLFLPKMPSDDYNTCITMEQQMWPIMLKYWSRNYGSRKFPDWRPLCTYVCRMTRRGIRTTYDLHYLNPNLTQDGVSNVAWYVLKYMLKPSDKIAKRQQALRLNLDEDEYHRVWNEIKPRIFVSKDFGLARDPDISRRLHSDIDYFRGQFDYPVYLNHDTGQTFPLSKFYKSKGDIYDVNQATYFALNAKLKKERQLSFSDCQRHADRLSRLASIADDDRLETIF